MERDMFDIRKFDEYKEADRREVKKAKGGLPLSLWDLYPSLANSNVEMCFGGGRRLMVYHRAEERGYEEAYQEFPGYDQ